MAENSSILLLLQRYLDDQLTESEYGELAEWLQQYPGDQPWSEWLQELGMQQAAAPGYDRNRWQPVVEAILRKQGFLEEAGYESQPVRRIGVRVGRWATAAAVLLAVVMGGYFLVLNKNKPALAQTQQPAQNDIPAPTGTRATLTLASGKTILLDSMQSGTLVQQGNAQVAKLANNQLAYNVSTEKPTEIVYNTLSTAKGGQTMVVLADGTKVWLNAASSITYPTAFMGKERVVKITGEAYFEVFRNASKPFRVSINGKADVEVLGTHFNINAYADEPAIRTTLLEGSVRVAAAASPPAVGVNTNSEKLSVVLKAGQQAQLVVGVNTNNGKDGTNNTSHIITGREQLTVVSEVDVEGAVAWKNGFFQFDGADIQTVMRALSRWYNVKVRYEGEIPDIRASCNISRDNMASVVMHVLQLGGLHFRVEGDSIIITP